jgi:hypothetical protein
VVIFGEVAMFEEAEGMNEIVQTDAVVHITDRKQFFAITPEQGKRIKSISFDKINVDKRIAKHYFGVINFEILSCIGFFECKVSYSWLREMLSLANRLTSLKMVKLNFTAANFEEVLVGCYPYLLKHIDISGNSIGVWEWGFEVVMQQRVYGILCLDKLNISGNGFSPDFVNRVRTALPGCLVIS